MNRKMLLENRKMCRVWFRNEEDIENEKYFIRKYKNNKNLKPLREIMELMEIKRAVVLVKITDNPYVIYNIYRLIKKLNLSVYLVPAVCFKYLYWKDEKKTKKFLKIKDSTIYIAEKFDINIKIFNKMNCIFFDLYRLSLYLDNAKGNFVDEIMIPIVNTVENSFTSIGICGENVLAEHIYRYLKKNDNIKLKRYSGNELRWNNKNNRYELDTEECPEMIFHLTLFTGDIWFKDKIIYCIDMDNYLIHGISNSVNGDIIWNILPCLEKGGVRTMFISPPEIKRLKNAKELKKMFVQNAKKLKNGEIKHPSVKWAAPEVTKELEETMLSIDLKKGYFDRKSKQSGKYVNLINGIRFTVGNSTKSKYNIEMFGPCILFGDNVEDSKTISSLLRKKVSEDFCIINKGSRYWNMNITIRLTKFKPGDIAIIFVSDKNLYLKNKIPVLDLTQCYRKVPNLKQHLFDNLYHCDEIINQYVADDIYQYLTMNHFLDEPRICENKLSEDFIMFGSKIKRDLGLKGVIDSSLKQWLNKLENVKCNNMKCGAIVMNCNPFTKGHRYLIETSARQVDMLYVFVVQEDKSVFPFKDRFYLVKEGTKDIKNLKVLPSGQYMISTLTMPGYFEKEYLQDTKWDASQDLNIFAKYIAPVLNITVRFAGEEPLDHFTRQYNESMKEIFPEYGIKFMEIPRKEEEGEVISASRVRRLLKEKNWKEIRKMVPDCTYEYLLDQKAKCF